MKLSTFFKRVFTESPLKISVMIICVMIAGVAEGCGILLFLPLIRAFIPQAGSESLDGGLVQKWMDTLGWHPGILTLLGTILAFFAVKNIFVYAQRQFTERAAIDFELKLKKDLVSSLLASDWRYFSSEKTGELANAAGQNSLGAGNAYRLLILFFSEFFSVFVYCAVGLIVSWKAFLLCGALGAFCAWPLQTLVKGSKQTSTRAVSMQNETQNLVLESLLAMKFIKGNHLEEGSKERLFKKFDELADTQYTSSRYTSLAETIPDFLVTAVVCAILYGAHAYLNIAGENIFVLIAVLYRLIRRMLALQVSRQRAMIYLPYFEHCHQIMKTAEDRKEIPGRTLFSGLNTGVRFENVHFSYGNKKVLEGVSFEIQKNSLTALVGKSGSGKTTILDLLLNLLHPQSGRITIDGHDLSGLTFFDWRSRISYVPQDVPLMNGTVADNIRMGNPGLADAEVKAYAKAAHADEFIDKMPQRYETAVGERGLSLSGGQRQRLAIARALARKPDLLILDEATSALDSESERMVQKTIQELKGKMTILIVAHRFSTIEKADVIYVLDGHRIAGAGTKENLLTGSDIFKRLYQDREEAKC